MNTAQAVALLPNRANRARDRAGRPASPVAALYLVPSPKADHPAAALPVTVRPVGALPVVTRPAASSPIAGPLRLTRRGRIVAAALAALLVTALAVLAAVAAQATNRSVPQHAARQNLTQVMVRPGETLWAVAESADPNADTRLVIQRIIDLNGLNGDVILVSQRLWVPRT